MTSEPIDTPHAGTPGPAGPGRLVLAGVLGAGLLGVGVGLWARPGPPRGMEPKPAAPALAPLRVVVAEAPQPQPATPLEVLPALPAPVEAAPPPRRAAPPPPVGATVKLVKVDAIAVPLRRPPPRQPPPRETPARHRVPSPPARQADEHAAALKPAAHLKPTHRRETPVPARAAKAQAKPQQTGPSRQVKVRAEMPPRPAPGRDRATKARNADTPRVQPPRTVKIRNDAPAKSRVRKAAVAKPPPAPRRAPVRGGGPLRVARNGCAGPGCAPRRPAAPIPAAREAWVVEDVYVARISTQRGLARDD